MKKIILFILFSIPVSVWAQSLLPYLRSGNKAYDKKEYEQAEIDYRRALQIDSTDIRSRYNLANTLYRMGNHDQSLELYQSLSQDPRLTTKQKHRVFHNLGNTQMQKEAFDKAVDAYKEALKIEPNDKDTKYNLVYAQKKLKQQQQQQQQQNKDQTKKPEKDQEKKEDQKKQDSKNQDKKDPNPNQQGQDDNRDKNKTGRNPDKLKPSDAERMLKAMENQEKKTLNKMKRTPVEKGTKPQKDW